MRLLTEILHATFLFPHLLSFTETRYPPRSRQLLYLQRSQETGFARSSMLNIRCTVLQSIRDTELRTIWRLCENTVLLPSTEPNLYVFSITMKTVDIGRLGEKAATRYLRKNGYRIVACNSHFSHNEIDIIAKNKEFIVFVEVKARSTDHSLTYKFGTPASAVTRSKQQRTVEAARAFLRSPKYSKLQPRFDVIEVHLNKEDMKILHINHIINAFGS